MCIVITIFFLYLSKSFLSQPLSSELLWCSATCWVKPQQYLSGWLFLPAVIKRFWFRETNLSFMYIGSLIFLDYNKAFFS